MRRMMMVAIAVAMLTAGSGARGQIIDPSTGITVNASTDPMDFSAIASGQPGNAGMEAGAAAEDSANAMLAQQQADQQAQDFQNFMNSSSNSSDDSSAAAATPSVPKTAKPVIGPKSSKVAAGTKVTISDSDADALVYFTTDGSRPTTSSEKYVGPIVVSGKEKVQALAFDVNDVPSGVVKKTFSVKG
jgi:hypothetical protein